MEQKQLNAGSSGAFARAALVSVLAQIAQSRAASSNEIVVALVAPEEPVRLLRIENSLQARQALIGALIQPLEIGIEGAIALVNRDAILNSLPFCRFNPASGLMILGTFLILALRGNDFVSLPRELLDRIEFDFGPIEGRELLES